MSGFKVKYDNYGNLLSRGFYNDNGNVEGLYEIFHMNGNIHLKGDYKNGKLDGIKELYLETGELIERSSYKQGERHGKCECWGADSKVTAYYEKGVRTKLEVTWNEGFRKK